VHDSRIGENVNKVKARQILSPETPQNKDPVR